MMKKEMKRCLAAVALMLIAGMAAWAVYREYTKLDLNINGSRIGKEEYLAAMDAVQYDTKVQIQQQYDAVYDEDFWKRKYSEKYGYEILVENTVEWLKYTHAVYDIAEKYKDIGDSSYEAAAERWEAEMESRSKKTEQGQVIYGLKEYSLELYLKYEISMLKEAYCNDTDREGMELAEEEILEHYQSREWIFDGSEENADLETARIAVERDLREKKYDDMIAQKEKDSQVEGDMDTVLRFTLKNILQ